MGLLFHGFGCARLKTSLLLRKVRFFRACLGAVGGRAEDRFFHGLQRKMAEMELPWDPVKEPSSARRKCHRLDTRGRSFFRVCQRRSISFSRKMVLPRTLAEEPYLPSFAGVRGRKVHRGSVFRSCGRTFFREYLFYRILDFF